MLFWNLLRSQESVEPKDMLVDVAGKEQEELNSGMTVIEKYVRPDL